MNFLWANLNYSSSKKASVTNESTAGREATVGKLEEMQMLEPHFAKSSKEQMFLCLKTVRGYCYESKTSIFVPLHLLSMLVVDQVLGS